MNDRRWSVKVRWPALLLMGLVLLPGCKKTEAVPVKGEPVKGKVYYKGQVVPFGAVQFYNGSGLVGTGLISSDGSYEAHVPEGNVQVCVVTDQSVVLGGAPPQLGGAGIGGHAGGGNGPPGGRPGAAGGTGNNPPIGGPPGAAGGPPGAGPPTGARVGPPGVDFDPLESLKLTAEDKQKLKEVQEKYGSLTGKTPYTCSVREGEQTLDIELK
jgi:hypothetical protein